MPVYAHFGDRNSIPSRYLEGSKAYGKGVDNCNILNCHLYLINTVTYYE